jgi:diacylglycerol kinase (ATP)
MITLPKRIVLIANPVAGGDARSRIEKACTALQNRGATVELVLTGSRGDALKGASAAREAGPDLIVAAGGDGTLNEVINGLAPSKIPLAFIPLGTTNVFALEAGIPFDIDQACAIALSGFPRPICLGMAGKIRFLLMAGVGFDAQVVYGLNLRLKRLSGKLSYILGGIATLALRRSRSLELVDESGEIHQGYGAILSNCRLYAGRGLSFTPQASPLVERLDVCLLIRRGRLGILGYATTLLMGRSPLPPAAICLQGKKFVLRGEGIPVQVDGDYIGRLPMEFQTTFGEITLVFPAASPLLKEA